MLCKKCHSHQNMIPIKGCDFCTRLNLPENVLCDITRGVSQDENLLECGAYRPKLSLVSSKKSDEIPIEHGDTDHFSLSDKEKWFKAYSKQQLQLNPDKVHFKLQYHVCLITNSRNSIFSNSDKQIEDFSNIFDQIADYFDDTQIKVLWLNADHIHLYVNTGPDYSVDEIVDKIIETSEKEICLIHPQLNGESNKLWASGYFAETIG